MIKSYGGDYWANPNKIEANINSINLLKLYEVLFQFNNNSVRHIHTVQPDPYTGLLWVSTGDEDAECKICLIDPDIGKIAKKNWQRLPKMENR